MSNKKLTTDEKELKSKKYAADIKKMKDRLADLTVAKKKLDAEIAAEKEKELIQNYQKLGKRFAEGINAKLSQEKYEEIMDFMFMHEDCIAFIAEVIRQYEQEVKLKELAESDSDDAIDESVESDIPA